jgi:hypothetical protein
LYDVLANYNDVYKIKKRFVVVRINHTLSKYTFGYLQNTVWSGLFTFKKLLKITKRPTTANPFTVGSLIMTASTIEKTFI